MVSANCVPVAMDLAKIEDAKTPAGDFFRNVQKQRPKQFQGIYVVDLNGKVLGSQPDYREEKAGTLELLDIMRSSLKAFGDITPRRVRGGEPFPHRGVGVHKDGSVTLSIYLRINRDGGNAAGLGSLTLDSLTLSAKEWATLLPPKNEKKWHVPMAVARKWNRVLTHASDHSTMPLPEEVTDAKITGHVESVKNGITYLLYEGSIEGSHVYKYKPHKGKRTYGKSMFLAYGAYDAEAGQMLSVTFMVGGNCKNVPPYDELVPFSGIMEWRRDP
jgi:hypothetical protein